MLYNTSITSSVSTAISEVENGCYVGNGHMGNGYVGNGDMGNGDVGRYRNLEWIYELAQCGIGIDNYFSYCVSLRAALMSNLFMFVCVLG